MSIFFRSLEDRNKPSSLGSKLNTSKYGDYQKPWSLVLLMTLLFLLSTPATCVFKKHLIYNVEE